MCPPFQSHSFPGFKPQVPHSHESLQTCRPQHADVPLEFWEHMQSCVAPGEQTPSPEQEPNEPHWQVLLQVRFLVPHLPQSSVEVEPAVQTPWPAQVPNSPQ